MLNINFVIFDTFLYYSNHHIMKRREFHYTIWYHYKRRTGTFVNKFRTMAEFEKNTIAILVIKIEEKSSKPFEGSTI